MVAADFLAAGLVAVAVERSRITAISYLKSRESHKIRFKGVFSRDFSLGLVTFFPSCSLYQWIDPTHGV